MVNVFEGVKVLHRDFNPSGSNVWLTGDCPECGPVQLGVVGAQGDRPTFWMRCTGCGLGIVRNGDDDSPSSPPLRLPAGLPPEIEAVWQEARNCLSLSANTAAVMLCRKILFHMAVEEGLPHKNASGYAPNFTECVDHLKAVGILTSRMQPWADSIKKVGNEANHEIVPVGQADAITVAEFTLQLLVVAYEMAAKMQLAAPNTGQGQPTT